MWPTRIEDWATSLLTASYTPGADCGRGAGNAMACFGPRGQLPNTRVTAATASAVVMSPCTARMVWSGCTYLACHATRSSRVRPCSVAYVTCRANAVSAPYISSRNSRLAMPFGSSFCLAMPASMPRLATSRRDWSNRGWRRTSENTCRTSAKSCFSTLMPAEPASSPMLVSIDAARPSR